MATFKLTAQQQEQIRRMSPDAADRQIAIWRKQWEDAQRVYGPPASPAQQLPAGVNPYQPYTAPAVKNLPAGQPAGGVWVDGVYIPPGIDFSKLGGGTKSSTGGGGGGGGGGGAPAPAAASTSTPNPFASWQDAAKELYGGYYAIVQSVPELQGLLQRAYTERWSRDRFEYELRQTNWYRTNSESARQFDIASQVDPATAQQQIRDRVAEMRALGMNEFGIDLSESVLSGLARSSIRLGWNQQLIAQAVGLEVTRAPGGLSQLAAGFLGQSLRTTAKEFGIPLAESTQQSWLVDIATGKQTRQTFQSYVLSTAKRLYPTISSQLDSGQTFQQIVDPYRNFAAQILELNPQVIDFIDPKWTKAINFSDPKGQRRTMDFDEWGDYLRQDRQFGYEYTSQAEQRAYEVVNDLANLFGKV
jgi:hypothetical protein